MNNLIPSYIDAVRSLVGDENVAGTVTGPVKDLRFYNNAKPPTEEAIQTKLASMISDYDAQEYARNRATAFPSIGDQLDMLWHAIDTGDWTAAKVKTTDFYTKLKKVKDDNPKPS